MSLISLRCPDEITVSVDMSKVHKVVRVSLGLTSARLAGFDDDLASEPNDLPVTINGIEYPCKDYPFVRVLNIFEVDSLICWVEVPDTPLGDPGPEFIYIFGLNKQEWKDVWHVSPLVIKVEAPQGDNTYNTLDDFFKLKQSEQFSMLGL